MSVSVVIPCYRSGTTLPPLVGRIRATMTELVERGSLSNYEIILIVDGSPDDTDIVAQELSRGSSDVSTILMRRNFGQHNALVAGIRAARYDVVLTMDDDLQHPPEEIPKLLQPLESPAVDLVYALPETEEHGPVRSFASRLVKRALSLAGVANAEWVGAFRAFRTDLREGFAEARDPQVNLDVLLSWATSRVVPVRVTMNRREHGRSSYGLVRLVKHTLNMVTGYGTVPLRIATWLGFAFALIGLVMLVNVVVRYFLGETTVQGFTTLVAIISMFAGAQMLTIGIIGEYIGRQHFRSMNRPMYVIRAHENPPSASSL